jgi:hypothetical protein
VLHDDRADAHQVGKQVNKPDNDAPNLVVELEPEPTQLDTAADGYRPLKASDL